MMKELQIACKECFPLEMNANEVWRGEDCEKLDSLKGCGGGVKNQSRHADSLSQLLMGMIMIQGLTILAEIESERKLLITSMTRSLIFATLKN